jgi:hypothetical protein
LTTNQVIENARNENQTLVIGSALDDRFSTNYILANAQNVGLRRSKIEKSDKIAN